MTKTRTERIFLSPPHMGGEEMCFVKEAFASNYIAPLGPMVDSFEREFAEYVGIKHCLALSSGTAAIQLGLRHMIQESGIREGRDSGQRSVVGGQKQTEVRGQKSEIGSQGSGKEGTVVRGQ